MREKETERERESERERVRERERESSNDQKRILQKQADKDRVCVSLTAREITEI